VNAVAAYVTANHERLGLERLGVPRRPACVVLTPRFDLSRHVVVLVLADRNPVLVGKLPRLAGDGASLATEARCLRRVACALRGRDHGTVPELLDHRPDGAHPLLLERALPGRPLAPRAVRRARAAIVADVAAWLTRLATATAAVPPDGWHERLVGDEQAAESLRHADLPAVFEHGDLCHPNLLRQPDGRLGVLDWERADPAGVPAADLFTFLAYAAVAGVPARRRPAALRAAFDRPDGWAWPVAEGYARRLGIDPALLPALQAVSAARRARP
jgi:aminoglycoside phosphotransferase